MHICMTYLNEGDGVLVPNPGYPTYRSAVKLAGGTCIDYTLSGDEGWLPDFDELDRLVEGSGRVKLMWVNYPHMPTGKLPDQGLFERLVAFGKKHGILICHDNPYSFILNENPMSLLAVRGGEGGGDRAELAEQIAEYGRLAGRYAGRCETTDR